MELIRSVWNETYLCGLWNLPLQIGPGIMPTQAWGLAARRPISIPSVRGWLTDLKANLVVTAVVDVFVANRPSVDHRSRKSHKAFCVMANSADRYFPWTVSRPNYKFASLGLSEVEYVQDCSIHFLRFAAKVG